MSIDENALEGMGAIVGAHPNEVAVMNSLTVNMHLLMIPFYRPTATRFKILMEAKAFPSDYYAIASQVKLAGFDPDTSIIQLSPKQGYTLSTAEILAAIDESGDEIYLVMFSGLQFYTGQLFDIKTITKHAQAKALQFNCRGAVLDGISLMRLAM